MAVKAWPMRPEKPDYSFNLKEERLKWPNKSEAIWVPRVAADAALAVVVAERAGAEGGDQQLDGKAANELSEKVVLLIAPPRWSKAVAASALARSWLSETREAVLIGLERRERWPMRSEKVARKRASGW